MGYFKDHRGIDCYEPDNNSTTLYIQSSISPTLQGILDRCKEHFGDAATFENIEISAENIHTDCIYNLYGSGDYTNFIVCTFTG